MLIPCVLTNLRQTPVPPLRIQLVDLRVSEILRRVAAEPGLIIEVYHGAVKVFEVRGPEAKT